VADWLAENASCSSGSSLEYANKATLSERTNLSGKSERTRRNPTCVWRNYMQDSNYERVIMFYVNFIEMVAAYCWSDGSLELVG